MGFLSDGSFHPFIEGYDGDLATLVAEDAARSKAPQVWTLEYSKQEKKGTKVVADLKASPTVFATYLSSCISDWLAGNDEAAAYAAAFGTSVAVDGKGNTKPTALHFTAANQHFLEIVETIRASVTVEWTGISLFKGHTNRLGSNLRWDPGAERNWALMANDPNDAGTSVDAPLEWLAFRGLPLLPSFPRGSRIATTAVGGRGEKMKMTWPLWSVPASFHTIRSIVQLGWSGSSVDRSQRGIFALCSSEIRRTSQGFGNFGPASVTT